jgi:hypothetical protein
VRGAVYIAGGDFMAVNPLGANGPIEDIEDHLLGGAKELLNDIVWWANAAKATKA